ncbi:2,3-bisphosphoglycerate-independent phosphoglycerate mutase [Chondromyces crocatus]|uniref:2,3-bisphosphoglycerate-independent phosphoglycerate mutase n=1 Tax=Chondromyces crocatus TaxID=52 RepID=A0A0K1EAP6_CHOCO|nr:2,3-bisphosphoglycerate-independent phosphoglycerate mutase [Chondromyces crocatus]AKT37945.1 phosphoglyceromutase [Chondromyces crocatus]
MSEAAPPLGARRRPLVLCVLDGLGERSETEGNAVARAQTPRLTALAEAYPRTTLAASGVDVGLPEGLTGCSASGHLNLGAGRVPRSERSRIDEALAAEKLATNEVLAHTFTIAKEILNSRLHLFCLVSGSDVHASRAHLHEVIRMAQFFEVQVVLHVFLDGRQPSPRSAWELLEPIEDMLKGTGVIGTLSGRYYAMDRDGRWDRARKAYEAIVRGPAERSASVFEALQEAYAMGLTEERIEPVRIGDYEGMQGSFMADFSSKTPSWEWFGEEVGLSLNVRADRLRQLSAMFVRRNVPEEVLEWLSDRGRAMYAFQEHCFRTLTEHDPALQLPTAFPREHVTESLGEVIAAAGLKQLRCGESEKAAHVTWMFSGGRETPFEGEERRILPSPRDVASHVERPEMNATAVAAETAAAVKSGAYDFILVNFANPDVLGHTGNLDVATRAVEAVDAAVGVIADAVLAGDGVLMVTSAHGNCEEMLDEEGRPHADHTRNPVPFHYVSASEPGIGLRSGGRLEDVAPTLLELLGLPQPAVMTGRSLRVRV